MKHLSASWAALTLLAPAALIVALIVVPLGCGGGGGGGSAASPLPTSGFVQVGLVDSPTPQFQHLLLNVVSIRITPIADITISDADPNWRTINPPSGLGATGELQIDLDSVQDEVELFNSASVAAQRYNQIELVLDFTNPGTIVPNCPQAPGPEGCISYPFQFQNPFASLRVIAPIEVTANRLSPVVVDFNPGTIIPPIATGGTFLLQNPKISVADATALMGQVTGAVSGVPGSGEVVSAEPTGGNTVTAGAVVVSGKYTLALPAANASAGTTYDLFLSAPGITFAAVSGIAVTRGSQPTPPTLVVKATATGSIAGAVSDSDSNPIQGATINLLIPPVNDPSAACDIAPFKCVVVTRVNTDETGHFPLASQGGFNAVPVGSNDTLEVSAAGFDTTLAGVSVVAGQGATCGKPGSATRNCSFHLTSNTISGTVAIDVPPAATSDAPVLVFAEDSGTNTIENVTMVTIPGGGTSQTYSLHVPTSVPKFDLIAVTQDTFNGAPSPFPGHTIVVEAAVPGGTNNVELARAACAGHGSITGMVANESHDAFTTVRVFKNGVAIAESTVGTSPANAGQYSFCTPPDAYSLQVFQNGVAVSSPVPFTVQAPGASPTPCPSVFCSSTGAGCSCVNSSAPAL